MRKLLFCLTVGLASFAFAGTKECDDAFAKADYVRAYQQCLPVARGGDGFSQAIIGFLYDFGYGGVPQDYTQAVTWYDLAARQGVAFAQNNLGYFYQNGIAVPKNEQKAFELYQKAAAQGNMYGQYNVGYFYDNGIAVTQNYSKALEFYRKAADQNYDLAQNALGAMYEFGKGVKQDVQQALTWYRKAADQGYSRGQYNVGYVYRYLQSPPNEAEAFKWFQKSALQGFASAQTEIGYMYQYGEGVKQDLQQALRWYGQASEQGDYLADYYLGLMHEDGNGVARNLSKAMQYYQRAAEAGYGNAQNNLGRLYQYGEGIPKDLKQALFWYQKAADQDNKYGLYNLALLYANGNGVQKDLPRAAQYLQRSADLGYPAAQTELGFLYIDGNGVAKNEALAVQLFKKAADQNDAVAQAELGYLYLNGIGVTKDERLAVQWSRKAADAGNPTGQNNLGYMYELGLGGLTLDYRQAVGWYKKAADQDYTLGQVNMGVMYENGTGVPEDLKKAFEYYMMAAMKNDPWALNRVGIMYYKGKGVAKDDKKAEEWLKKAIAAGNKEAQTTLDLLVGELSAAVAPPANTPTNTPPANTPTPGNTNQIKIEVLDPKQGAVVTENWIFLKLRTSEAVPGLEFKIRVNGQPIGTTSRAIGVSASTEYELAVPLDAAAKTLNLEISAFQGSTMLGQSTLNLSKGKAGSKNQNLAQGNLYVLAVGIDEYKYVSKDRFLKYSVKDATDIVAALKKQAGEAYLNVFDFTLLNSQATWENIQASMIRIQKLAKPEDTVIAFFSGHGEQMDGRYYVITYDTDPQYLRRTGLMQDELTEFYSGLNANTIVMLDTCRSGGINGVRAISNPKVDGLVRALQTNSNANSSPNLKKVILAATGGESFAYEDTAWGNGAFTKAFLEALKGEKSAQNNQGLISVLRLGAYIGDRVQELTGGKQVPNIQLSSSDWIIAVPDN